MVAQIGKNLTSERFKILSELWKEDIHAEMLYKTKRKIWAIKQNRLESSENEIKTENNNDDVEIIAN